MLPRVIIYCSTYACYNWVSECGDKPQPSFCPPCQCTEITMRENIPCMNVSHHMRHSWNRQLIEYQHWDYHSHAIVTHRRHLEYHSMAQWCDSNRNKILSSQWNVFEKLDIQSLPINSGICISIKMFTVVVKHNANCSYSLAFIWLAWISIESNTLSAEKMSPHSPYVCLAPGINVNGMSKVV